MYRPYTSTLSDSHPIRDVESQLRNFTQDFATSFNTGNYDLAAGLFAPDGVLMASHHEAAYGQKQVERLLREMGESGYGDLRLETTRVDYSGDMAMELGRFHSNRSEGGRDTSSGTRQVCKSLAAAGSVVAHG